MDNITKYITNNLPTLGTEYKKKIVAEINAHRLEEFNISVEISFDDGNKKVYQLCHLGQIDASLMESSDFDSIYNQCLEQIHEKFGSWYKYLVYVNNFETLEDISIDGDFRFRWYGAVDAHSIEYLIASILEISTEIQNNIEGKVWTVKTSKMTIAKYKNDTIKVSGLSSSQWMQIASTVTELKSIMDRV